MSLSDKEINGYFQLDGDDICGFHDVCLSKDVKQAVEKADCLIQWLIDEKGNKKIFWKKWNEIFGDALTGDGK